MKFSKLIGIIVLLVAAQLSAFSAEIAVLRSGFSISFDHRQQRGSVTRLFTTSGFVDVPTAEIASFEKDDTPPPAPVPPPTQVATTNVAAKSAQPPQANGQPTAATNRNIVAPIPGAIPAPLVPSSQQQSALQRADIDALVREASSRYQLDPDFVASVIKAESDYNTRARSPKGALGLMQLMPQTAAMLGVKNPLDPKENVDAGTAHLNALLELYHDDPIKALAAYNAGAHRVEQYHGVPPYWETRAYVAKIVRDFNAKKRAQMKMVKSSAPATKATKTAKSAAKTPPPAKSRTRTQPQQASASKPAGPA